MIVRSSEISNFIRKLNEIKSISNAAVVFQEDQERGTRKQGPPLPTWPLGCGSIYS